MALPFAKGLLIRYLTDKVVETVNRQVGPSAGPEPAGPPAAAADLASVLGSLNAGLIHLQQELTLLEARLERLERRQARLEQRWSWQTMAKVVLAVAFAFALGFALWQLLRLGGWDF